MKKIIGLIGLMLIMAGSARADMCFFGYTAGEGDQPEMTAVYDPPPDVTLVGQVAEVQSAYDEGRKAFINFEDRIFEFVPPVIGDCDDYSHDFPIGMTQVLRSDWEQQTEAFFAENPALLTNPDAVAGLVIASEISNRCTRIQELSQVAYHIKNNITNEIPIAIGLPLTETSLPSHLPFNVDTVGVWNYEVLDPNTDEQFQAAYNDLLNILGNRKIIWVLNSFCGYRQINSGLIQSDCASEHRDAFNELTINYANWISARPEIIGQIAFTWKDFEEGGLNLGAGSMDGIRPVHQLMINMKNCEYVYIPQPVVTPGPTPGPTPSPQLTLYTSYETRPDGLWIEFMATNAPPMTQVRFWFERESDIPDGSVYLDPTAERCHTLFGFYNPGFFTGQSVGQGIHVYEQLVPAHLVGQWFQFQATVDTQAQCFYSNQIVERLQE